MTDPITAVLLMVAGITAALLFFAGIVSIGEHLMRHIPTGARSTFMHDHIRRMR